MEKKEPFPEHSVADGKFEHVKFNFPPREMSCKFLRNLLPQNIYYLCLEIAPSLYLRVLFRIISNIIKDVFAE